MQELENRKLKELVNTINNKDWDKALKISQTIQKDELEYYRDKTIFRIGLAFTYYYLNNEQISDDVADSFLHKQVTSITEEEVNEYFPSIDWFNIYIGSLLHKSENLERKGDTEEAFYLLTDNVLYNCHPADSYLKEKLAPLYNREIVLMYKLDDPETLTAVKEIQGHDIPLSKEVTDLIGDPNEKVKAQKEKYSSMEDYELKSDSVVFINDVYLDQHFDPYFITSHIFPGLKGRKKWIFKKNLTITGDLLPGSIKLEVRGNTKITGNLIQAETRTGASMLFKGDLEAGGYIIAGGTIMEGSRPLSFTVNGQLKATFLSTNSKVSIKGTIVPETLIIVNQQKENVEGYNCHNRIDIKEEYRTEECRKQWEKFGRGFIWLDYNMILEAMEKGENIFKIA